VPISQAASYAAADAAVVLRLIPQLQSDLEKSNATKLFSEIEMPLVPVLADMEMAGISVDIGFLENMSRELSIRLSAIEAQIFDRPNRSISILHPAI
jgi:DNA polymerase-1